MDNEIDASEKTTQTQAEAVAEESTIPHIPWPSWDATATEWISVFLLKFILYVGNDAWGFIFNVLVCLTPLLMVAACMSYRLAKEVELKQRQKKMEDKVAKKKAKVHNKKKN